MTTFYIYKILYICIKYAIFIYMKKVVIGSLGYTLDKGKNEERWARWRPTVSIFQHNDFKVDRIELLSEDWAYKLRDLVVEDIKSISPSTEVSLQKFNVLNYWNFEDVYSSLLDFAKNYKFDTENEEYYLHISTGSHVAQICYFLLTESRYFPAKLLQTGPGKKRIDGKITHTYNIIDLDLSKYDLIANRFKTEFQEDLSFLKSGIDTKNPAFNKLIEKIELVASKSIDPLLLMGPTGAGKSKLAKQISALKKNKNQVIGKFIEVNCATLRGDSAMSALFGHIKGAFTGALTERLGYIAQADKGILFLDEIGELGLDEQAMLLRAIEEKTFYPMGSDKEVTSDFQLIAGTNKDLFEEVKRGTFREDLLARINIWTFYLPGLKDRKEDIAPNIDFELNKLSNKVGSNINFSKEAKETFLKLSNDSQSTWNGNFRDLNTIITRLGTLSDKGRISRDLVESEMNFIQSSWKKLSSQSNNNNSRIKLTDYLDEKAVESLDLFDRLQLESILNVCSESKNIPDAGRKLFSKSREKRKSVNDSDRLRKYLAKFGVQLEDVFSNH